MLSRTCGVRSQTLGDGACARAVSGKASTEKPATIAASVAKAAAATTVRTLRARPPVDPVPRLGATRHSRSVPVSLVRGGDPSREDRAEEDRLGGAPLRDRISRGMTRPANCGRSSALGSRLSALGSRLSALGSRLSALGSRLSALGSRLSALGSRLSALGSRLSALGSRLSALGSRLSALGSRLSALGSRLSALGSRLLLTKPPLAPRAGAASDTFAATPGGMASPKGVPDSSGRSVSAFQPCSMCSLPNTRILPRTDTHAAYGRACCPRGGPRSPPRYSANRPARCRHKHDLHWNTKLWEISANNRRITRIMRQYWGSGVGGAGFRPPRAP